MNEWMLVLTYKCDWHCTYCIMDTHGSHRGLISLDDIKSKLSVVKEGDALQLSGGEPGLAHPKIVDYVMETLVRLKCDISINTNGLFLKRYKKYYNNVDRFLYHCSEYLDLDEDIYIPEDPDNKIDYMVTVDDDRISRLEPFLDKYADISFGVYGADMPYSNMPNRTSLSKMNALKILHKFKDRMNPKYRKYLYSSCSDVNESIEL
jgi:organic radical activating enzyme